MLINDRYTINAQSDFIDSGGFGRVYKAYDNHTETTVALKQFLVNNINERANLKAELLRAKALAHPNIVKYLDYFETKSTDSLGRDITEQWAVMEYIEGGNLTRFIEKETAETKTQHAKAIFDGIIKGLDYLHTRRWDNDKSDWITLIHRDLKPANILLQYQSDKITPKICDFGLSKEVLESHSGGETTSTAANSTIEYAAPELFNPKLRKDGAIQTNYDYWALGIIIYRYFKNAFPFGSREQGNTQEQIMTAILDKEPALNGIPKEWLGLVENCLVKDGNKRGTTENNEVKPVFKKSEKIESTKSEKKIESIFFIALFIAIISIIIYHRPLKLPKDTIADNYIDTFAPGEQVEVKPETDSTESKSDLENFTMNKKSESKDKEIKDKSITGAKILKGKTEVGAIDYNRGGYIVYEEDGHGLVAAPEDFEDLNYNSAKYYCKALEINGFGDWRLPTSNELELLYDNLYKKDFGGFVNTKYWSSSKFGNYDAYWCRLFDHGGKEYVEFIHTLNGPISVRAVRTF